MLVCAQSNTAVDWISEKLVDRGVNVLRIGNPTRVNDKMLSFTYERRFEGHPAYAELWSIRKAIRETNSRRGSYEERESARNRLSRLRDRATQLEIQINAVLEKAEQLILDFEELEYLSSAGLRVLLSAHKAFMKKGSGKMLICHVNETIYEVFEVTGFLDILNIE